MIELILLIAQVSASLTSIFGIITIIATFLAIKKLRAEDFRNLLIVSAIFLIVIVLGVSSMTIYHFTEDNLQINKLAENVWYILMFLGFIFSIVESITLINYGKSLSVLPKKSRIKSRRRK